MFAYVFMLLRVSAVACDFDGTLAQKFPVPASIVEGKLDWWHAHCQPTPLIWRTVMMVVIARFLGRRVYVWTNRYSDMREQTIRNLGLFACLFSDFVVRDGRKSADRLVNTLILDDEPKYAACSPHFLLIK